MTAVILFAKKRFFHIIFIVYWFTTRFYLLILHYFECRTHSHSRYTYISSRWDKKRNHRPRCSHRKTFDHHICRVTCSSRVSSWSVKNENHPHPFVGSWTHYEKNIIHPWSSSEWPNRKWDLSDERMKIWSQEMTDLYTDSPRRWNQSYSSKSSIRPSRSHGRKTCYYRWDNFWSAESICRFCHPESSRTWMNLSTSRSGTRPLSSQNHTRLSFIWRWNSYFQRTGFVRT